jgi:SAM-dependent methyltransferase
MSPSPLQKVKRYWNRRPCNIRHSRQPLGTRKYFQEVEKKKYFVEPHIPPFSEFRKWKGKRVLEIGCGIGTAAVSFARAGAIYTGLDLSEKSLELARQRFRAFGLKGRFLSGNAEKLGRMLPGEKFDLIYSFGVIHHTPRPEAVVREVRKMMGPKSEFRLMLYAKNSWKNFMIAAGLDRPEAQAGCPIAFTYNPEGLKSLLRGLTIVEMKQTHIFPYQIPAYKKGRYKLQPWFAAMPRKMFQALESHLGWHWLIRCRKK